MSNLDLSVIQPLLNKLVNVTPELINQAYHKMIFIDYLVLIPCFILMMFFFAISCTIIKDDGLKSDKWVGPLMMSVALFFVTSYFICDLICLYFFPYIQLLDYFKG